MLNQYIQAAMRKAKYEILEDDGTFYGEIPGFQGVYANSEILEDCRNELLEILEGRIFLCLHDNLALPTVDGMNLVVERVK
jgi:predicted RNase H-like HicB family nuclease